MRSKKTILAAATSRLGVTRIVESLPERPSLLILTYHRVGDAGKTPYDPGIFSCTAAELDWQVSWLKQRYDIVSLPGALDIVHGRAKPARTAVLLTFDDGYLDNYELAFPVFRKHGVSATFFLVTTFVGTGFLPWWDEIAYMVKCSAQPQIKLVYPKAVAFDKKAEGEAQTLMAILKLFKLSSSIDTERFLNELSLATRCRRPGSHSERCFLNWDEAREMQQAGMCFGSHTHTHEILARLPYERQVEELRVSRQIMERELGGEVDTLAYPSGEEGTFSESTFAALREAKYRTAFSYYAGVNLPGKIDVLDVLRAGVDNEGRPTFRLRAAMYAATGRGLV